MKSKMGQDFFRFLPSEIMLNIFLRLPTPTTMSCKCVCKPWLDLLETPEFVKSHFSKSVPGLAVFIEGMHPKPYKAFQIVDKPHPKRRFRRWNMILNFNLPFNEPPYTSADGFLFLCTPGMTSHGALTTEYSMWPRDLFICNPIIREYIKLPPPPGASPLDARVQMDTFGFGASRVTGQYKLVRVFHEWSEWILDIPVEPELFESKCQVYDVGTGSWSGFVSAGPFKYEGSAKGVLLDGNIHWMVTDMNGSSVRISCFDLETQLFSTFSAPPLARDNQECLSVSTLRDRLCLCDNSGDDETVIWLIKDYGDERSWTKEFVIRKNCSYAVCPIRAFHNGDILMAMEIHHMLLYFSRRTYTIRDVDVFGLKSCFCIRTISYTPSFRRLRTLTTENDG